MNFSIKNFFIKCYQIWSSKIGASRSKWESRKICIESNQLIKIVDKSGDVNFRCIGLLSIWRNIIFLKMNDKITQTSFKMRNNKYIIQIKLRFPVQLFFTSSIPLVFFYVSWKHQKTRDLLMFSGGKEWDQPWHEMDRVLSTFCNQNKQHVEEL